MALETADVLTTFGRLRGGPRSRGGGRVSPGRCVPARSPATPDPDRTRGAPLFFFAASPLRGFGAFASDSPCEGGDSLSERLVGLAFAARDVRMICRILQPKGYGFGLSAETRGDEFESLESLDLTGLVGVTDD